MLPRPPRSPLFPYTTLFRSLVALYGRGYRRVIELAGKIPGGGERLCPENPDILAQLHLAVQDELAVSRSEEHTSELQSLRHLVCRLLLEKKKKQKREI